MKKQSSFKMKGFSGFGNSPMKAKNKNKVEVDFNNPNVEKNYKENAEFRKYLKEKKGVTYDPKTRVSKTVKPVKKSPAKMGGGFDPAKHVVNFREGVAYTPKGKVKANINVDKISKKPANASKKAVRNFSNAAKTQRKATGKVAKKVAAKIGGKLLGPVGVAMTARDAYKSYKDVKGGMKIGKALKKNFLGL